MLPEEIQRRRVFDPADFNIACGGGFCFHSYPSVVRAAAYPVIPGSILVDQRLASVGS
jgi:hypothetical protein